MNNETNVDRARRIISQAKQGDIIEFETGDKLRGKAYGVKMEFNVLAIREETYNKIKEMGIKITVSPEGQLDPELARKEIAEQIMINEQTELYGMPIQTDVKEMAHVGVEEIHKIQNEGVSKMTTDMPKRRTLADLTRDQEKVKTSSLQTSQTNLSGSNKSITGDQKSNPTSTPKKLLRDL